VGAWAVQTPPDFSGEAQISETASAWFISQIGAEILRGHAMLVSETGSGQTPEAAVENAWEVFSSSNRVVINATGHNRREVRWNGYMWEDLHIEGPREVAAR